MHGIALQSPSVRRLMTVIDGDDDESKSESSRTDNNLMSTVEEDDRYKDIVSTEKRTSF